MKLVRIIGTIFPFKNKTTNILFFLCMSPLVNWILTNIYYYNCGGNIKNIWNFINLVNPFNTPNPLCMLLLTIMGANLYVIQYIYYIFIIFVLSLLFN